MKCIGDKVNYRLEPGDIVRVVSHSEPLKPDYYVRRLNGDWHGSYQGNFDLTFKPEGWDGLAWHKVKTDLSGWVHKTFKDYKIFCKGNYVSYEIIEVMAG